MALFKATTLKTTRQYEGTITLSDLKKKFKIPENAQVQFVVPTGGDHSGMRLDLNDTDLVIYVSYEKTAAPKKPAKTPLTMAQVEAELDESQVFAAVPDGK